MVDIVFNKNVELIFGLLYCVNKDYGIEPSNLFIDTIPFYCKEFYDLYQKNIDKEFVEYIKNGGLDTFNRSVEIALAIDDNYNIVEDEYLKKIKQNNPNFDKTILEKLLKSFVNRSHYDEFYEQHESFYQYLIDQYKKALSKYVEFDESLLNRFYGYSKGKMKIILYNFTQCSFGYCTSKELINVRCVQNVGKDENHIEFSSNVLINCFHEFSHSFINPLGYQYFKNVDMSNLLEDAKKNGLPSYYNDAIVVINEYVVRAVQIYLGKKYMENEYMKRHINNNKKIGYKYVEGFFI